MFVAGKIGVMHRRVNLLVFLLAFAAITSIHSAAAGQSQPQATEAPAPWVDPSTGLMWASQGGEMIWYGALASCLNLEYARLTGWRLPSLEELQDIHDRNVTAPAFTGVVWSSARGIGDRGLPNTESWYFNFSDGTRATGRIDAAPGKHVLCVRLSPEAIARARAASPYWVDPSTRLMWAGQDNGKDVTLKDAATYCQDLRLAEHSDWRLATIDELDGINDRTAKALGLGGGKRRDQPLEFRVKGNLFLTGDEWSRTRAVDERGILRDAWLFDFVNSRRMESGDEAGNGLGYKQGKRALCVRGSEPATLASDATRAPAYWVDPSTGLMWAGKDNGEDVNWQAATTYCQGLRLAGYSDWRLPTINELDGIYGGAAKAPGGAGKHGEMPFSWHVKGNLFLTGEEWSSTHRMDAGGRPSRRVWYASFAYSKFIDAKSETAHDYSRALCVRQPGQ